MGINHSESMIHHHRSVQGGAVRAAIFGVSDGLVSNSALILGVAAASLASDTVVTTGVAGLIAGATSMAAGEYISVKAQSELIERELRIERESLATNPQKEVKELKGIYMSRGLTSTEAGLLADAIHRDPEVALEVHAREELGVDPDDIGNPVGAAVASFFSFALGAIVPLLPWLFSSGDSATVASLILAGTLAIIVGVIIGWSTDRSLFSSALRQLLIVALACGVTFAVGNAF